MPGAARKKGQGVRPSISTSNQEKQSNKEHRERVDSNSLAGSIWPLALSYVPGGAGLGSRAVAAHDARGRLGHRKGHGRGGEGGAAGEGGGLKKERAEESEKERGSDKFSSLSSFSSDPRRRRRRSGSCPLACRKQEREKSISISRFLMVLIDLDALECPLCAEQLDATELCLRLCECDYKICLFCYQRLVDDAASAEKSSGSGGGAGGGGVGQQSSSAPRCPNCRTPYDTARIDGQAPDPAE